MTDYKPVFGRNDNVDEFYVKPPFYIRLLRIFDIFV